MEGAINTAESEIYALLNGRQNEQEFRRRYPNLVSDLTSLDLSLDQRLVLASDPYLLGMAILRAVKDLKQEGLEWRGKTRYPEGKPSMSVMAANDQCAMRVKQLKQQVEALRRRLGEEYRKTYE
jgi:hypothetical protein